MRVKSLSQAIGFSVSRPVGAQYRRGHYLLRKTNAFFESALSKERYGVCDFKPMQSPLQPMWGLPGATLKLAAVRLGGLAVHQTLRPVCGAGGQCLPP